MTARWLRCRNWEHWQTYRRDRNPPPWIKVHRRILQDMEWSMLTDAEKGQLVSMWVLAADRDGAIPDDARALQRLLGLDEPPDLPKFKELGFLTPEGRQDDAGVTSSGRQSDAPEPEADSQRRGEEKDAPAPSGAGRATRTPPHPIPADWWPNATNLRWLGQAGVSDTDQVAIIDEFKRWAANSGLKRANWDLAFGRNPAVKSAVGRARTNGGASEGTNGHDPWSLLARHVKDGHRLADVEADDPALAATVQELGGMRRLRDMTERDFAFLEKKFRETYQRKSAEP